MTEPLASLASPASLASARVLVVGASGQIGRAVCDALAARGATVIATARGQSYPLPAGVAALDPADTDAVAALRRDAGAVDAVVHLGSPVLRSIEPWSPDAAVLHRANVVAVGNLVARFGGPATTFCFVSSSTVYGPPRLLPVREDHPLAPASLYAVHKLLGELWTQHTCALGGTRALVLRLGQVYGPGTPPHIAARAFLERALAGDTITLTVPPTTIRDYVHVDDAAQAVVAALAARATGVFNIAGGAPTTLWEWAHLAVRCAGTSAPIVAAPASPEAPSFWMDITAARDGFGWVPRITPADGMARERARTAP